MPACPLEILESPTRGDSEFCITSAAQTFLQAINYLLSERKSRKESEEQEGNVGLCGLRAFEIHRFAVRHKRILVFG